MSHSHSGHKVDKKLIVAAISKLLDRTPHRHFDAPAISLNAITDYLRIPSSSIDPYDLEALVRPLAVAGTLFDGPTVPRVKYVRRGLRREYWIVFESGGGGGGGKNFYHHHNHHHDPFQTHVEGPRTRADRDVDLRGRAEAERKGRKAAHRSTSISDLPRPPSRASRTSTDTGLSRREQPSYGIDEGTNDQSGSVRFPVPFPVPAVLAASAQPAAKTLNLIPNLPGGADYSAGQSHHFREKEKKGFLQSIGIGKTSKSRQRYEYQSPDGSESGSENSSSGREDYHRSTRTRSDRAAPSGQSAGAGDQRTVETKVPVDPLAVARRKKEDRARKAFEAHLLWDNRNTTTRRPADGDSQPQTSDNWNRAPLRRPTRKETIQGPGGEDSWEIIDSYENDDEVGEEAGESDGEDPSSNATGKKTVDKEGVRKEAGMDKIKPVFQNHQTLSPAHEGEKMAEKRGSGDNALSRKKEVVRVDTEGIRDSRGEANDEIHDDGGRSDDSGSGSENDDNDDEDTEISSSDEKSQRSGSKAEADGGPANLTANRAVNKHVSKNKEMITDRPGDKEGQQKVTDSESKSRWDQKEGRNDKRSSPDEDPKRRLKHEKHKHEADRSGGDEGTKSKEVKGADGTKKDKNKCHEKEGRFESTSASTSPSKDTHAHRRKHEHGKERESDRKRSVTDNEDDSDQEEEGDSDPVEEESEVDREQPPTPHWEKTFQDLPFGPDLPVLAFREWIEDRWKILVAEIVAIMGMVYIIQATGL
ncbi:hypothetical protein I316_03100 [Kwoniella heveanensis BCC8398]|uniref:Uncharacterized protein n=1 Tax=Kwoniella heveanensis BCC8398 TaxID=1296120 RepID=A0A1B9GVK0_9TREE|nr:hypothetical protein I316_03100 [Kwoniella heveanensis BCC8398]